MKLNFLRLSADEQRLYMEHAAIQRDLSPVIMEKDFWVCWLLGILFNSEFADSLVFKGEWRNKGFGKMLIRYIEDSARKIGFEQIGIGVSLYADYGPAQKLYFHLGYSPDGCGVTCKYQSTAPRESYSLDDELILWFTKKLIIKL